MKLFEHAPNNIYPNPYRFLNNKKSVQETDPLADSQKDKKPKKGEIEPLREPKLRVRIPVLKVTFKHLLVNEIEFIFLKI